MRNEKECDCSMCLFRCNIFIGFRIIKEMPGLVGSGTPCMYKQLCGSYRPFKTGYLYVGGYDGFRTL